MSFDGTVTGGANPFVENNPSLTRGGGGKAPLERFELLRKSGGCGSCHSCGGHCVTGYSGHYGYDRRSGLCPCFLGGCSGGDPALLARCRVGGACRFSANARCNA